MLKTMRTLLCLMMSVAMVLTISGGNHFTASAEETLAQPRLSYTNYVDASLSITSAGSARCIGDVEGYSGITTKVHINMKLQQYITLQWTTIGEWSGTFNDFYGTLSKRKTLTSSGRYRVKVVATVYSGSKSEEVEIITTEKYFTKP